MDIRHKASVMDPSRAVTTRSFHSQGGIRYKNLKIGADLAFQ